MQDEQIKKFLTEKGFRFYPNGMGDADYVVGNYHKVLYGAPEMPECLTNDKPIQIGVRETFMTLNDDIFHQFAVGFCNHAPQGWADFKFYGIDPSHFIDQYDAIEKALIAAWRALFEVENN